MTSVDNPKIFFAEALRFLKEHQWMYNYPNTHILHKRILDKIPGEWLDHLNNLTNEELNNLPFGKVNENWPDSLKSCLKKIQDLQYTFEIYITNELPKLPARIRITPKKRHEIACLAVVVHDVCSKMDVQCIVDVGAGLGYLSHLLQEKYSYKVLAIEGNEQIFNLAVQRQEAHQVKYLRHFITPDSLPYIARQIQENFGDKDICITGLHTCADLGVTIFDMFEKLQTVKSIVVMPCCYHRLEAVQTETEASERFRNFPISSDLRLVYDELAGWAFLRQFFLRLACQQTKRVWKEMTAEEHVGHMTSCMYRAIIQLAAEEENLIVKRLKRKPTKTKSISQLIDNFETGHLLLSNASSNTINYLEFKGKLHTKWEENAKNCKLIEALTAFQVAIQGVCENVVLLDRICLLKEKGLDCQLYKVTDDTISPRCHAIVATKVVLSLASCISKG